MKNMISRISLAPPALMIITLGLGVHSASVGAAVLTDDFSDNAIGSEWKLADDSQDTLTLNETNQRLQAVANNPSSSHTDAIYLSTGADGFRVSTANSFDITISYTFIPPSTASAAGDVMGLDLGVGTDKTGVDSVAAGFGYTYLGGGVMVPGFAAESRLDDTPTTTATPELGSKGTGTLEVKYDSTSGVFTLSDGIKSTTRAGLIADWGNPTSLLVSFGARGDGFTFDGTSAFLDNFSISGDIVTPEPSATALLVPTVLGLIGRRRRA